jgi:2-(1,2-epoxy-1,2-dihydrophenyl)acetyl-CoA isomerase
MTDERIDLQISHGVGVVTLDHPEVLNALSAPMLDGLAAALDVIEDPGNGVRCVLMTGAGRAFCAGANLTQTDPSELLEDGQLDLGKPLEDSYHPLLLRLRDLPCPLVTAVNGAAAGAGMSLAIMGDLVLAARSATFLQAFRGIGLVPDCGSTFLLPRLVGWSRAMELSLVGEKLSAEQALEWGLINRVCEDGELMAEAMKLASDLAAGPTVALGLIRKAYWESFHNDYESQLRLERELQRLAGRTKDFMEGVSAGRVRGAEESRQRGRQDQRPDPAVA